METAIAIIMGFLGFVAVFLTAGLALAIAYYAVYGVIWVFTPWQTSKAIITSRRYKQQSKTYVVTGSIAVPITHPESFEVKVVSYGGIAKRAEGWIEVDEDFFSTCAVGQYLTIRYKKVLFEFSGRMQ